MGELLTAEEVAKILKVSPSAIFKWAKRGIIPSYRLHEKCLRFKITDVKAFVEGGKEMDRSMKTVKQPLKRYQKIFDFKEIFEMATDL